MRFTLTIFIFHTWFNMFYCYDFFTPNTSTWWILSMCNIHNHIHVKNDSPISISLNSCAFLPPRITIAQLHIFFPEDTTVLIRNPLQLACINHLRFSIAIVWNVGKKKRWNVICCEHNHIRMMNFNLIETKNVRVMQIDMRCVLRSKPKADISRHLPQYRPILSNHLNGNKKQKSQ